MPVPPAPNRERVDRFTWDRHYFRDRTPLVRTRRWLCLIALVLSAGWAISAVLGPKDFSRAQFTHGEVASAHAAWNDRCDACHQPSSRDNVSVGGLSASAVHERWNTFTCQNCHPGQGAGEEGLKDYAPHHVSAVWKQDQKNLSCAACHHDHQGRDFSLVKLADSDCTQCHQDLKNHHQGGTIEFAASVTSFSKDHPDFNGKKKDFERTLRFNHDHHMLAGIPYVSTKKDGDSAARQDWKLSSIAAEYRERYRLPGQSDSDAVQLNCVSCHQLDGRGLENAATLKKWDAAKALEAGLPSQAMFPARSAGAYYLPVTYEAHCLACHPIRSGEVGAPGLDVTLPSLQVAHRLTAKGLDEEIRLKVIDKLTQAKAAPKKDRKGEERLDPIVDETPPDAALITKLAGVAKDRFFAEWVGGGEGCLKCHVRDGKSSDKFDLLKVDSPQVWYPHAKFNHASHRAMNCASCHDQGKDPKQILDANGAVKDELLSAPAKPDIPGLANCVQCHAPAHSGEINGQKLTLGGVRHSCTDCHRYHAGDAPLQGLGSPLRNPPKGRALNTVELLGGTGTNANKE